MTLVAALAFVNRADTLLLFAPLLASCFLSAVRARHGDLLRAQVLAALPAVLWLAFAIVYYGFPLPNTFYAKVGTGLPTGIRVHQGLADPTNSVRYDPVTLGTLAAAVFVVGSRWKPRAQVLLGASLYACYAVWVGGEFMGGRLFSLPFLSGDDSHRLGRTFATGGVRCRGWSGATQYPEPAGAREDGAELRDGLAVAHPERDQG